MSVTIGERLARSRRHWKIRIGTIQNNIWCWWIDVTQEHPRKRAANRQRKYGHD